MPTVSLADAIGPTPSQATPTGPDVQDMTVSHGATPADEDAYQGVLADATKQVNAGTMKDADAGAYIGQQLSTKGINLTDPKEVTKVSLANAFGGTPAASTSDNTDSGFQKVLHGITQPIADEYGRIKDDFNKPDEETTPGRPMTPEERSAWDAINKGKMTAKELLLAAIPGNKVEDTGYYDFGTMAKTLPPGYGQQSADEAADANSHGIGIKNPLDNFLKNNSLNQIISAIGSQADQQKSKYDQVQKYIQSAHIAANPDNYTPVQKADATAYLNQVKKDVPQSLQDKFDATTKAITTDPGKFVSDLVNGLTADPELAVIPGATAGRLGVAAEGFGAAAKLGGMAARTAVAAGEGATINTAISAAQQSNRGTGGIDATELRYSAATGAAMGGVLGGILHRGALAKTADMDAANANGTLDQILKDQAAYDATVEASVKNSPSVPDPVKQRINDMLGITSNTDKEAYLKQRRADVKSAFKTDSDYADYLEYKAGEAADLHQRYQDNQDQLAQQKASDEAKANDVDQAYSQSSDERKTQFQQDFDAAQAQRNNADLTDTHTQAIAEDNMRTSQDKIDAEDAMLAAHSDDLPAVKQAMAKIQRRNPTWKARGAIDPELLARFGVTAAGAGAGAYLGGPDHRLAGGLVGALAGMFVPAGGDIGKGIGGNERGVIGGRSAATADVKTLDTAQQMESMGRDSAADPTQMKKEIYNQTGWYRGRDGAWKFEIPDTDAHINGEVVRRIKDGGSTAVKNVLNHPELWKAYPKIADVNVRFADMPKNSKGHYDPARGEIVLNKNAEAYTGKGAAGSLPAILLHEVNHIVQFSEGHARGGNVEEFLNKVPEYKELKSRLATTHDDATYNNIVEQINKVKRVAYDNYRKLAGEVESRNVQTRYAMPEDQRMRTMPETTEDTPADKQIVKFDTTRFHSEDMPKEESVADTMAKSGHVTPDSTLHGVTLKEDRLPNEQAVIEKAKGGNQQAYSALYKQYFPRLKNSVQSFMKSARNKTNIDAEDIAQQAFIQAFKNLDKFHGDSTFYTWLYRIAQNEGLQTLRAGDSRVKTTSMFNDLRDQGAGSARAGHIMEGDTSPVKSSVELASASHDTPEAMARAGEVQHQLEYAFSKLNPSQRTMVKGVELEGRSIEEMASELGLTKPVATVYLQRGRDNIAASLEKGLGANRVIPNGKQSGNIDPDILKKLAIGGAGALTGAYLNKKHPVWGALLGAGAFILAGRGGKNLWSDIDHVTGVMSTRIKNKSEAIHFRAKEYYRVRNTVTHDLINAGHPFLKKVHNLPEAISNVLQRSILTGNRAITDKLLDAVGDPEMVGSWKLIKKVVDGLGTQLADAGMIKKTVEDYFPRIVKDKEGLFKALGKEQSDSVKQLLDQANRESIRSSGNPLSQAEESEVINKAISAFMYSKAPASVRAGYTHARRFQEIPPEFQKYYANLAESYHSYIRTAVKNIEMAKFFGKDLVNKEEAGIVYPDIDKSIGRYVESELRSGKITSADVAEVSKMLRSSFVNFEKGGNKTIQAAKNITMAGYLGNPLSAAMQITTPIVSTYLHGIMPTIKATAEKLTGNSKITAKDLGLAEHMSEEFVGTTKSAKFLRNALNWGSFSFSDLFDKDIKLNSAIIRARDLAKTTKGVKKLEDQYGQAFGDRFPGLVQELKSRQLGQNTKALAYQELSRSDPIDPLEFSQFYADNPNGRNLMALKSYMLKQVDLIRRDAYDEIKNGNRAKGIKNLAALSLVLGISGMAGTDMQDVMLGRKIKFRLSDIPLNMIKTFGWSEYASSQAFGSTYATRKNPTGASKAKGKLFQTVGEAIAPPIPYQAMDDIWNRDPRAVAMIPIVGRFLAEYYKNKNKTPAQKTKEAERL